MAKKQPKPVEPTVLDAQPEEATQLVREDVGLIRGFLSGSLAFFATATTLQREAKERLDVANQWKTKALTRELDEKLQVDLRLARAKRQEIDKHWSITSVVSRFHKSLVAGRESGGLLADEAVQIQQTLHNTFVREEERKAREEEQRRRDAEEARVRAEREADAQRLEAEALRLEADSPMLSEREEQFVNLVMHGYNTPTVAARHCGYKNPEVQGARLMESAKIQRAIKSKQEAAAVREQVQATLSKPVNVAVEKVRPNVSKLPGTRDVKRWKATVYDEAAFLAAVLDPKSRLQYGIPTDVITYLQPKLNELARSLHEKMNTWPGVRAEEDRSTS